ncbi:MAG: hypothetical protein OXU36_02125 [Candidatus Poribacteria bacterium]|nr:hypothetical protein [Candidatus Poribacteria bacterium]
MNAIKHSLPTRRGEAQNQNQRYEYLINGIHAVWHEPGHSPPAQTDLLEGV